MLESIKKTYAKMRCVCKIERGNYICGKSRNFGQKFGKCVVEEKVEVDDDVSQNTKLSLNFDLIDPKKIGSKFLDFTKYFFESASDEANALEL